MSVFDGRYDEFFGKLFGERIYQVEAVKAAVAQFLIPERFDDECFSSKNAGVVHVGTGLGKTRIMFGVAVVALCEAARDSHLDIDRVVIVSPNSNTVSVLLEREMASFMVHTDGLEFNVNREVLDRNDEIIAGGFHVVKTEATAKERITSLSELDSEGQAKTLMLIDEAHHVFKQNSKGVLDTEFGKWLAESDVRYVMGFTGTPYNKNHKISEVVFEYSVLDGISDRYIKTIYTVDGKVDSFNYAMRRFNKVREEYGMHIKPVCLFVYKDIAVATAAYTEFCGLLDEFKFNAKVGRENVALVHSKSDLSVVERFRNINKFNEGDSPLNFIFSVNMATEGWDCNDVYTIIPSEDRAFNSKLLVAQVIGRGLRFDKQVFGSPPEVHIAGHDKFKNASKFINQVTGLDKQLKSFVDEESSHNFGFVSYQIEPVMESVLTEVRKMKKDDVVEFLGKLTSGRDVMAENVVTGSKKESVASDTNIMLNAGEIRSSLESMIISSGRPEIANQVLALVEDWHKVHPSDMTYLKGRVNNFLSGATSYMIPQRKGFDKSEKRHTTSSMSPSYCNPNRMKDTTVMFSGMSSEQNRAALQYVSQEDRFDVVPAYNFNCPQDIVFLHKGVELPFARKLLGMNLSWVKSPDTGFFEIPGQNVDDTPFLFNPDFLIWVNDSLLIVETKPDGIYTGQVTHNDTPAKIVAKIQAAEQFCEEMGDRYQFRLITPTDFDKFFHELGSVIIPGLGKEHEMIKTSVKLVNCTH